MSSDRTVPDPASEAAKKQPVTFAEKQSMRRRDRPECNQSGHHCDGWCTR